MPPAIRHNREMKLLFASLAALAVLHAAETKLGKPLTQKEPVAISSLLSKADDYVGKTVQVKGKITEVCQEMGCWMNLVNSEGQAVRIKVKDGEIVFPKDSAGKNAVAEGKFTKIEMTREQAVEQAKHEAEERGTKFDAASVKGAKTVYQIQGTGAVILD
jgi:hypothetical protein